MKKPELLMPASCLEVLKTAVRYGADAVYIGGEAFSLRAKAKNFPEEDMREGIRYAHERGVKVYVTANILAHNEDLAQAEVYFRQLKEMKPDAILISDPGFFEIEQEVCPEVPVHLSTQANNTNAGTFRFWYRQGVRRVVTARELSLKEIAEIRAQIPEDMEIESFVHGAMCISYSGRCLLSSFLAGRDANRGACTHPCRWRYSIVEETRPGEYMPVYENERGTYIFNSKDLCMIEHLPDLIHAGIDSLKVEGRMKTALYVATVARAYRMAIDRYMEDPEGYEAEKEQFAAMVSEGTYRNFTTGFYYGKPGTDSQIYDSNTYQKTFVYLGIVSGMDDAGHAVISQKNKFCRGDEILIMKPDGEDRKANVLAILDENGTEMESAPHPGQELHLCLDTMPETGDVLKMKCES